MLLSTFRSDFSTVGQFMKYCAHGTSRMIIKTTYSSPLVLFKQGLEQARQKHISIGDTAYQPYKLPGYIAAVVQISYSF